MYLPFAEASVATTSPLLFNSLKFANSSSSSIVPSHLKVIDFATIS
jgi:hypothetical protein